MHVMFLHKNFPAQFRYIAPRLVREHGWKCTFVTEQKSHELPGVTKLLYQKFGGPHQGNHYCVRAYEDKVCEASSVYEELKRHPDLNPDLIVAHSGFGSSLFLPLLYDAPIINFFEFYYRTYGRSFAYRPEIPVTEADCLRIHSSNAMILQDLDNCDQGWTPTHYQRDYFPSEYHNKIEVMFDGIDTAIYHRRKDARQRVEQACKIEPGTPIVTYVARGFEMMRGFDIFMRAAKRIYTQRPDVTFVVVGADRVCYGGDLRHISEQSFRHHVLGQDEYDQSRFRFTGMVPEETLAEILSATDLHIYITEPFIASWSMVDAMGCGAVVLASDQACVREYITDGVNGLLFPFFEDERLAERALAVLRDPAGHQHLAQAAVKTVRQNYSVDVAMPRVKAFFERVAGRRRAHSSRFATLVRSGSPEFRGAGSSGENETGLDGPGLTQIGPDELAQALKLLPELTSKECTLSGWVQACQEFGDPKSALTRIGPRNHPTDLSRMLSRIVEVRPRVVLNMSDMTGGRLFLFTRVADSKARLISTSLPGRSFLKEQVTFYQAFARGKQRIECADSPEEGEGLFASLKKLLNREPIDLLFIDGLRSFTEVRGAFERYRPLMRKGGLIAWDGVRPTPERESNQDGGNRLWPDVRPLYPRNAEYFSGCVTPVGGIVMIKV